MDERENDNAIGKKSGNKKPVIIAFVVVIAALAAGLIIMVVHSNSPAVRVRKQLEIAQRYLEDLDYEQAIAAYEAVIEIEPNNLEAYLGLEKAYEGSGDIRSAIKVFEDLENLQGIELSEESINSFINLYKQLCKEDFDSGKYDEAEEVALKILGRNSSDKETIKLLCDIYLFYAGNALDNSEYDVAEKYYKLVLQYDPDNEVALKAVESIGINQMGLDWLENADISFSVDGIILDETPLSDVKAKYSHRNDYMSNLMNDNTEDTVYSMPYRDGGTHPYSSATFGYIFITPVNDGIVRSIGITDSNFECLGGIHIGDSIEECVGFLGIGFIENKIYDEYGAIVSKDKNAYISVGNNCIYIRCDSKSIYINIKDNKVYDLQLHHLENEN